MLGITGGLGLLLWEVCSGADVSHAWQSAGKVQQACQAAAAAAAEPHCYRQSKPAATKFTCRLDLTYLNNGVGVLSPVAVGGLGLTGVGVFFVTCVQSNTL
jgi:hypothetical protein